MFAWFKQILCIKLKPLFTKLLTPGLTCELCNPFDDWLESTCQTNHPEDYIICGLTRELKVWWIRPIMYWLYKDVWSFRKVCQCECTKKIHEIQQEQKCGRDHKTALFIASYGNKSSGSKNKWRAPFHKSHVLKSSKNWFGTIFWNSLYLYTKKKYYLIS